MSDLMVKPQDELDVLIEEQGYDDHFHEHHHGDKYQSNFITHYIFSQEHKIIDNTGDAAANMTLSQARAQAVVDYLSAKGISGMAAKGYGQNQPADTNDTEAGRQNNRRTELKIISK